MLDGMDKFVKIVSTDATELVNNGQLYAWTRAEAMCRQMCHTKNRNYRRLRKPNAPGLILGLTIVPPTGANRAEAAPALTVRFAVSPESRASYDTALARAQQLLGNEIIPPLAVRRWPRRHSPVVGPSGGAAFFCAVMSLMTNRLCRSDTAVSAVVTNGVALGAVGGLKWKADGARRAGLSRMVHFITDLDHQLNSIDSHDLCPDGIADHFDGSNATSAGQVLGKWLHMARKDSQLKRLYCSDHSYPKKLEWINNFKEVYFSVSTPSIVPFELVNERVNEKLTLSKKSFHKCLLKRCPIWETTTAVQKQQKKVENWDDNNLNYVHFDLICGDNYFF
ncbi:hypothetical protein niasHT_020828 [Heterodera trifolii]|uniref:Lon proteolytic domain-containing protein n=1 Tax=Heterodera trifolii TaxID=157864 RepID=A0ABD2KLH4_9BILA